MTPKAYKPDLAARRRMAALQEHHYRWVKDKVDQDDLVFRPDRPVANSDYNQHFVDVDNPDESFWAEAERIMTGPVEKRYRPDQLRDAHGRWADDPSTIASQTIKVGRHPFKITVHDDRTRSVRFPNGEEYRDRETAFYSGRPGSNSLRSSLFDVAGEEHVGAAKPFNDHTGRLAGVVRLEEIAPFDEEEETWEDDVVSLHLQQPGGTATVEELLATPGVTMKHRDVQKLLETVTSMQAFRGTAGGTGWSTVREKGKVALHLEDGSSLSLDMKTARQLSREIGRLYDEWDDMEQENQPSRVLTATVPVRDGSVSVMLDPATSRWRVAFPDGALYFDRTEFYDWSGALDEAAGVQKSATGTLTKKAKFHAAGLAVRAADTGRVLMLQRALTDDDENGGMWEFPGGKPEDDEKPKQAALREWAEETGLDVPDGEIVSKWETPDGRYRGFVMTVDHEDDLDVFGDRDDVTNPDDPDRDQIEAIAWWSPEQMRQNPALRRELAESLPLVLVALRAAPGPDDATATKTLHTDPVLTDPSPETLAYLATMFDEAGRERFEAALNKVEQGTVGRWRARHLIRWFERGEGAARIGWGTPGDFNRCVALASEHMTDKQAKGFCNLRHHGALGIYPATHAAMDRAATKRYNPSQRRDAHGRWSDGGGGTPRIDFHGGHVDLTPSMSGEPLLEVGDRNGHSIVVELSDGSLADLGDAMRVNDRGAWEDPGTGAYADWSGRTESGNVRMLIGDNDDEVTLELTPGEYLRLWSDLTPDDDTEEVPVGVVLASGEHVTWDEVGGGGHELAAQSDSDTATINLTTAELSQLMKAWRAGEDGMYFESGVRPYVDWSTVEDGKTFVEFGDDNAAVVVEMTSDEFDDFFASLDEYSKQH